MYFKIKTINSSLNSNHMLGEKRLTKYFKLRNSKVKSAAPPKKSIVSVIRKR